MTQIKGTSLLQEYADRITRNLESHSAQTFPPDAQKTLRSFSMKEVAQFLGVNQNTFRHYVTSMGDRMPVGTLVNGNRRYFTATEIQLIREALYREGKIGKKEWRRRTEDEELQVMTVVNLKGGVSKTSSALLVAQAMNLRGYRVLCIDLDAQASLTNMFGITPEVDPNMPTVYDVIRADHPLPITDVIRKTYFPDLDLLPVSSDIVEFEYETALSFRERSSGNHFYTRIIEALGVVESDYDLVIFDTPPQLSFAVISALFASTGLIIPLTASMLDVMSLSTFLSMTAELMSAVESEAGSKDYDFIRFLITRYESTDQPQVQVASFLRTILGESVFATEFVKSTAVGDAANTKQPVFEIDPREMNRDTWNRIMESINLICNAIEDDLTKAWGRA